MQYVSQTRQVISPDWLSLRSAAERMGITRARLYELVREGAIDGVLTELGWLFSPAEIDAYAGAHPKWSRRVPPAQKAARG